MVKGDQTAKKPELHNAWVVLFASTFTLVELY